LERVIHVSPDSPRIASVVESLGFEPHFSRPPELADDKTPLMPVLRFVTETFQARGKTFDEVWLLMACAPLIECYLVARPSDIDGEGDWRLAELVFGALSRPNAV
jgi:CMP-N-acetylneuraminic acid synthetase